MCGSSRCSWFTIAECCRTTSLEVIKKESMQRWAPPPPPLICALRAFEGEKKLWPQCVLLLMPRWLPRALYGPLEMCVSHSVEASGWEGEPPPSFLGRFSRFFSQLQLCRWDKCVFALYRKIKKKKRDQREWTRRGKCNVLFCVLRNLGCGWKCSREDIR